MSKAEIAPDNQELSDLNSDVRWTTGIAIGSSAIAATCVTLIGNQLLRGDLDNDALILVGTGVLSVFTPTAIICWKQALKLRSERNDLIDKIQPN